MPARNLSCPACRIRVRTTAHSALEEVNCPTCGVKLTPVSSAWSVLGFRLIDLGAPATQDGPDDLDRVNGRAIAQWLATH
jgi:hypothetical protein